ncbi:MAG: hypothetical protein IJ424_01420 [Oscillospiraceae bacterium]|nr:hypothetical protein [Oscillospiraceae bacterium]
MSEKFNDNTKVLIKAIMSLETEEECRNFLYDICTIKEIKEMSSRLEVAVLLSKGEVYTDIAEKTGSSTATISRVNRALNYGDGGYDLVIKRLLEGKSE